MTDDDRATAAIAAIKVADRAGWFTVEVQRLHPMNRTPRYRMVLALRRARKTHLRREEHAEILAMLDTLTNDQCATVERAIRERFAS